MLKYQSNLKYHFNSSRIISPMQWSQYNNKNSNSSNKKQNVLLSLLLFGQTKVKWALIQNVNKDMNAFLKLFSYYAIFFFIHLLKSSLSYL